RPRPAAVAPGGASAELAVIPAGDPGRGEAGGDPVGGLGGGGGAQVGGWRGRAVAQGEGDADVQDLGGVADQLGVAFKAGAAELLVGVAGLGREGGPGGAPGRTVAQVTVRWEPRKAASSSSLMRIWRRRSMAAVYGCDAGSLAGS